MKHEWRKHEKNIYTPKNKPEILNVPEFNYFTIEGEGNPNTESFSEYIALLYSLSYAIKMSPKKGLAPKEYYDYAIYPLEGIWDINDEAKEKFTGVLNKNDLVFKLMIRQPDFVDITYAQNILNADKKYSKVKFESMTEGICIQMLHLGSYDSEPVSFKQMEEFASIHKLKRLSKVHKEIYLSDACRTPPEKLKTVLRFKVEGQ